MSHTNLTLGSNWDKGEWPDYVFVTHGAYDGARYVPERTCEFTYELGDDGWWWYCSNCGVLSSEYDLDKVPNYCPNCGLKVIK